MSQGQRVLVIAHGHPDLRLGGAEIAAYGLFQAYQALDEVAEAWFIGRVDRGRGPSGNLSRRRQREYLWEIGLGDFFRMKTANPFALWYGLEETLRTLQPTLVHVHHYFHIGIELLRTIKRADPAIKLVLTLHEYLAICNQHGQMVKRSSLELCGSAAPEDCHRCFPEFSAEHFWLRQRFIQRHFDAVDLFIAPSRFLRQRYIDWGLEPDRIQVIENGQPQLEPLPPRPLLPGDARTRFGFFGQINPVKGVDVLLAAVERLSRRERKRLRVFLNGANLEDQPEAFRSRIAAIRERAGSDGCVVFSGAYRPDALRARMAAVDWVVIPSIWWENSPMVIQEAFGCGRPVICANIGGMAEKVRDGVDGLHFEVRNPQALADVLRRVMAEPELWDRLRAGIRPPLDHRACARLHLAAVWGSAPGPVSAAG